MNYQHRVWKRVPGGPNHVVIPKHPKSELEAKILPNPTLNNRNLAKVSVHRRKWFGELGQARWAGSVENLEIGGAWRAQWRSVEYNE